MLFLHFLFKMNVLFMSFCNLQNCSEVMIKKHQRPTICKFIQWVMKITLQGNYGRESMN